MSAVTTRFFQGYPTGAQRRDFGAGPRIDVVAGIAIGEYINDLPLKDAVAINKHAWMDLT
jgi:hypothetical protein